MSGLTKTSRIMLEKVRFREEVSIRETDRIVELARSLDLPYQMVREIWSGRVTEKRTHGDADVPD